MKAILMMALSVLMFNSVSYGQAMQSVDIVAHMDTLDQAATFLPSGDHLGRSGSLAILPNCSVTIAPTNDNGGGLIAVIKSVGLLDILGSKSETVADMSVYYKDLYTDDTKITENEAIIGYVDTTMINGPSKTLKIKKLSNNQALVTIVESYPNRKAQATSCRIKVN